MSILVSSRLNHELCYAVSDHPDRDFVFGGTIVSNGDIGYKGRRAGDGLNMTGTTHGSIVKILDDWYVFYHRLTHKSDYSRQACAEKIRINDFPNVTSRDDERFIAEISEGARIGFRDFDFGRADGISLTLRAAGKNEKAVIRVYQSEEEEAKIKAVTETLVEAGDWKEYDIFFTPDQGIRPLLLDFSCEGELEFKTLRFFAK